MTDMLYTVCMASWSVAQSGQTVMAGKSNSCSFTRAMVLVLGSRSQSLGGTDNINNVGFQGSLFKIFKIFPLLSEVIESTLGGFQDCSREGVSESTLAGSTRLLSQDSIFHMRF